jgi:hypothetical protein
VRPWEPRTWSHADILSSALTLTAPALSPACAVGGIGGGIGGARQALGALERMVRPFCWPAFNVLVGKEDSTERLENARDSLSLSGWKSVSAES